MDRWHAEVRGRVPLELEGGAGSGLALEGEGGGGDAAEAEDLAEQGGGDLFAMERALHAQIVAERGTGVGEERGEVEAVDGVLAEGCRVEGEAKAVSHPLRHSLAGQHVLQVTLTRDRRGRGGGCESRDSCGVTGAVQKWTPHLKCAKVLNET